MLTVGAVVIGRNEGLRLERCLRSLVSKVESIVYVDSGSIDNSVAFAKSLRVETVELDSSRPFSMARSRNAGLSRLLRLRPKLKYVQFIDGDCELLDGWIEKGKFELSADPAVAVVDGQLSERHPDASIYNRLCDLEWRKPTGEVLSCYGIAMMRINSLLEVGGFNEELIAGEEPELCFRLRMAGYKILRLNEPMATHDAAMNSFVQWWKRTQRAGYAYANGAWLQRNSAQRYNLRPLASIGVWGLGTPMIATSMALPTGGMSLFLVSAYVFLWLRIARAQRNRGHSKSNAHLFATFTVIGKFAQAIGVMRFIWYRFVLGRKQNLLIEHTSVNKNNLQSLALSPDRTKTRRKSNCFRA